MQCCQCNCGIKEQGTISIHSRRNLDIIHFGVLLEYQSMRMSQHWPAEAYALSVHTRISYRGTSDSNRLFSSIGRAAG